MIGFLFWTAVAAAVATVYYNKKGAARMIGHGSSRSKRTESSDSRRMTGV